MDELISVISSVDIPQALLSSYSDSTGPAAAVTIVDAHLDSRFLLVSVQLDPLAVAAMEAYLQHEINFDTQVRLMQRSAPDATQMPGSGVMVIVRVNRVHATFICISDSQLCRGRVIDVNMKEKQARMFLIDYHVFVDVSTDDVCYCDDPEVIVPSALATLCIVNDVAAADVWSDDAKSVVRAWSARTLYAGLCGCVFADGRMPIVNLFEDPSSVAEQLVIRQLATSITLSSALLDHYDRRTAFGDTFTVEAHRPQDDEKSGPISVQLLSPSLETSPFLPVFFLALEKADRTLRDIRDVCTAYAAKPTACPSKWPTLGAAAIAMDTDGCYGRCEVVKVERDKERVKVFFVDSGHFKCLPFELLMPAPLVCSLWRRQAAPCCSAIFQPMPVTDDDIASQWKGIKWVDKWRVKNLRANVPTDRLGFAVPWREMESGFDVVFRVFLYEFGKSREVFRRSEVEPLPVQEDIYSNVTQDSERLLDENDNYVGAADSANMQPSDYEREIQMPTPLGGEAVQTVAEEEPQAVWETNLATIIQSRLAAAPRASRWLEDTRPTAQPITVPQQRELAAHVRAVIAELGIERRPQQEEARTMRSSFSLAPDQATECVICMSQPADTTVWPCKHEAFCLNDILAWKGRNNDATCPICRGPIESVYCGAHLVRKFPVRHAATTFAAAARGRGGRFVNRRFNGRGRR